MVGEHLHPAIAERFEVLEGKLGVKLDGRESVAEPGDAVEIPPRAWHDWWNAGEGKAVVKVTVIPGDRFSQMIRNVFGFGLDGKTNAKGMPSILQLIELGREFQDVIVFKRPPAAVTRLVGALLGPIARRRGYRGTYPRYEDAESSALSTTCARAVRSRSASAKAQARPDAAAPAAPAGERSLHRPGLEHPARQIAQVLDQFTQVSARFPSLLD